VSTTGTLDQPPFGRLDWNHEMRWWERDGFALPLFDGAQVELYIPPAIAAPGPMPIPLALVEAAEALLGLTPQALNDVAPHVMANACEFGEEGGETGDPETIWRHVRPYTLTLQEHAGAAWALLECDCSWNPEDGLQLVLLEGWRWVRVSAYDGCLTDGEATGNPALDAWMKDPQATLPQPSAG
jgi:hypothetical protein